MAEYNSPIDIINRALQHCGAQRILTLADDSKNAQEAVFAYDKVRQAELQRNLWKFATRRTVIRPVDTTTILVNFAAFSTTATYVNGSVVTYNGLTYQCTGFAPASTSATPDITPSLWTPYFGPLVAQPWTRGATGSVPPNWVSTTSYASGFIVVGSDGYEYVSVTNGNIGINPVTDGGVHWTNIGIAPVGQGYYPGELVYYQVGSTVSIYLSLVNTNIGDPTAVPAWVSTQSYNQGHTVTYLGTTYQSTVDLNLGNTPTGTGAWVVQPGTQTDSFVGMNWLKLGSATYSALRIQYPLGSGPSSQSATRNVFVLPSGFLRTAPQDPKAGSSSYLGAPAGLQYNDWVIENGVIVSREIFPITYRFVADVYSVPTFDPMFCEALAARLALEICETLTQSNGKLQAISQSYNRFMGEARLINGIETGATEPPEDDWISCRI